MIYNNNPKISYASSNFNSMDFKNSSCSIISCNVDFLLLYWRTLCSGETNGDIWTNSGCIHLEKSEDFTQHTKKKKGRIIVHEERHTKKKLRINILKREIIKKRSKQLPVWKTTETHWWDKRYTKMKTETLLYVFLSSVLTRFSFLSLLLSPSFILLL